MNELAPREGYIPVNNGELYYREIGQGQPILLLNGGPDFDHNYFLPEMDRLSDSFRLIYYDQRGRGKSARNIQPADVTIESEIQDVERVREYFRLDSVAVLGHSWGGVLAMEYAIRHPQRVSRLILMNTSPASHDDYALLRRELSKKRAEGEAEEMKRLSSGARYAEGDIENDAAIYRIHFRPTLRRPGQLERVVNSLRVNFSPADIVKARAIEDRLYDQTWLLRDYNLLPKLTLLTIPTLAIHGDYDLIPIACADHIAEAIPGARLVVLRDCGHFPFIECPAQLRQALSKFFHSTK